MCSNGFSERSVNARVDPLDAALEAKLQQHGFTGRIEQTLEQRLGGNVVFDGSGRTRTLV